MSGIVRRSYPSDFKKKLRLVEAFDSDPKPAKKKNSNRVDVFWVAAYRIGSIAPYIPFQFLGKSATLRPPLSYYGIYATMAI